MTEPDNAQNGLVPRVADQVGYIVDAFRCEGIEVGVVAAADHGVDYLYAERQLLVGDEYLDRVLEILREIPRQRDGSGGGQGQGDGARDDDPAQTERVLAGVVLLRLSDRQPPVPEVLDVIDGQLGAGIATPNHVLTVAGVVGPCPATEPQEVYDGIEPYPPPCPGSAGAGVLVYMADTGLLEHAGSAHSWLAGVKEGDLDPLPPEGPPGTQPIPPYTGHGTFVAGIARCMAPAADIIAANAFKIAGSELESDLAKRLETALRLGVDIFHLSITTTTRKDLALVSFGAWLRILRHYKGVACVAAAGNSDSRRPFWPAAFPEVVSVGALAGDGRSRASFSNHGGWVDVYAPGRSLINAYATGTYTCHDAPYAGQERKFYGMAKWSGTSFSTPMVTGLIAARMSRTGENGQEAAAALLAEARRQAIPGVGAILLPCCGGSDRPVRPAGCGCGAGRGCGPDGGCCGCHA
jgi:subtilisin family serine protease